MGETRQQRAARIANSFGSSGPAPSSRGGGGGGGEMNPMAQPILDELYKLRRDPAYRNDLDKVNEAIDQITSGSTGENILGTGSSLLKTVIPGFQALDLLGSAVRSGANQAPAAARSLLGPDLSRRVAPALKSVGLPGTMLGSGLQQEEFTKQDEFGLSGFRAGLSFGEDPVYGKDLWFEKKEKEAGESSESLNFLKILENTPLDVLARVPDWGWAEIASGGQDNLLGLGTEIALDPLTYVGGPGVAAAGRRLPAAGTRGAAAARRVKAADRRLGREGVAMRIFSNAEQAGIQLSDTTKDLVLSSANQGASPLGGILANLDKLGWDANTLDALGIQRKLTFAGMEIAGTGRAAQALGKTRTGKTSLAIKSFFTQSKLDRAGRAKRKAGFELNKSGVQNSQTPWLDEFKLKSGSKQAALTTRGLATDTEQRLRSKIQEDPLSFSISEKDVSEVFENLQNEPASFRKLVNEFTEFVNQGDRRPTFQDVTRERSNGRSLYDEFFLSNASEDSKILAPGLVTALQALDELARGRGLSAGRSARGAADVGFLPADMSVALSVSELLDQGIGNALGAQGAGSLKQLFGNISIAKLAGSETVSSTLGSSFFKASEANPKNILAYFNKLDLDADDVASGLNRELESLALGLGKGGVEDAKKIMQLNVDQLFLDTYAALQAGDLRAVKASNERMRAVGLGQLDKQEEFLQEILGLVPAPASRAEYAKRLVDAPLSAQAPIKAKNLEARKLANGQSALEVEVHRILKNQFFNPKLADSTVWDRVNIIEAGDEELLKAAYKIKPEYVEDSVNEIRSWFEDFTATSQKRMDQYLGGDVDAIETIENLDVFFTTARLHNNVFSQGLEQASGVSAKAALGGLTESEADILARQVMNLHYKGGGVDSFGQIDGWAGLMKDSSDFVNSLKRSQLVDKNRATRLLASMNKAFKDFATFGPGFALRNATGAYRNNFIQGVRTQTYEEWAPNYSIALRALDDELTNFLPSGGSRIWEEIGASAQREKAKAIASTKMLTTGGVGAAARGLDLTEQASKRVSGYLQDRVGLAQNQIEQAIIPIVETLTTGFRGGVASPGLKSRVATENANSVTRKEIESYMRGALAWQTLSDGGTIEEAMQKVSRSHFDYWDLIEAGQVIDEFLPFYVFRSRMAVLAAETAMGSPGVASTIYRLENEAKERDPWGAGKFDRYTFGVGGKGGATLAFDFEDPFVAGFSTLESLASVDPSPSSLLNVFGDEALGTLAPTPKYLVERNFNVVSGPDGFYEDSLQPLRDRDGLLARVLGAKYASPLRSMLTDARVLRETDGEILISASSARYLSQAIPILGRLESLFTGQAVVESDKTRRRRDAQRKASPGEIGEASRKAWNTFFTFTGAPLEIFDESYQLSQVQNTVWDVRGYDDPFSSLKTLREGDEMEGPRKDSLDYFFNNQFTFFDDLAFGD